MIVLPPSLSSMRFSLLPLLVGTLVLAFSLSACDRYEFPFARTKDPKNAPEYSITPDINKSPVTSEAAPQG